MPTNDELGPQHARVATGARHRSDRLVARLQLALLGGVVALAAGASQLF